MNLKIYLLSFLLVLSSVNYIVSQNEENEIIYVNNNDVIESQTGEKSEVSQESMLIKKESNVNYKVNLGTSFSTSNFGNAISTYAAPEIRFGLAPKLSISTGFLVTNTTISDYYLTEKEGRNNFTNAYAFAGVDYQATQRLRISGEILYGMNKSPYTFDNNKSADYYLSFSAEYKITENLSVGLQVVNQNMGYSGFRNPFNRDAFGNYHNPYYPFSRF